MEGPDINKVEFIIDKFSIYDTPPFFVEKKRDILVLLRKGSILGIEFSKYTLANIFLKHDTVNNWRLVYR